jgi:protein dithiol:quinone oxidoreductase
MIRNLLSAHRRIVCIAAGLFSLSLVGYGFYLQHFDALEPCPLCIFQRMGLTALGIALIVAALPSGRTRWALRTVSVFVALAALATAGVAIRHLYIQSLPPGTVPACGATLDYMFEVFGPAEVIRKVLTGSGECAKVDWTFLSLAMPAWVLIWAAVLGTVGLLASWPRRSGGAARA